MAIAITLLAFGALLSAIGVTGLGWDEDKGRPRILGYVSLVAITGVLCLSIYQTVAKNNRDVQLLDTMVAIKKFLSPSIPEIVAVDAPKTDQKLPTEPGADVVESENQEAAVSNSLLGETSDSSSTYVSLDSRGYARKHFYLKTKSAGNLLAESLDNKFAEQQILNEMMLVPNIGDYIDEYQRLESQNRN